MWHTLSDDERALLRAEGDGDPWQLALRLLRERDELRKAFEAQQALHVSNCNAWQYTLQSHHDEACRYKSERDGARDVARALARGYGRLGAEAFRLMRRDLLGLHEWLREPEFFAEIRHKGGARVRELLEKARQAEGDGKG